MGKFLEVRRHSIKGAPPFGEVLSNEGVELARKVGEGMRGRNYLKLYCTSFFRTAQTLTAFAEGARDFSVRDFRIVDQLGPSYLHWVDIAWGKIKTEGMQAISVGYHIRTNVSFTAAEARRLRIIAFDLVNGVQEDGRVLFVGHNLLSELMLYGLTGDVIDPLAECEGFQVSFSAKGQVSDIFRL